MKKISAIGFDWGGVVQQNIGGSFADAAASFLHIDNDEFRRAYFLHNHMVNKGADSKSYERATEMWHNILTELSMPDRLDSFMAFIRTRPKGMVNPQIVELLEKLKRSGWKIGLLSNASIEDAERIKAEPCITLFDVALFSAEIDYMKPQPEAFLRLASELDVAVDELIFIDDSERSLSTAIEIGYTPILFESNEQLIADLNRLSVKI